MRRTPRRLSAPLQLVTDDNGESSVPPSPSTNKRSTMATVSDDKENEDDQRTLTADELAALKRPELQRRCKALGLSAGGKNAEMVERLAAHFTATTAVTDKVVDEDRDGDGDVAADDETQPEPTMADASPAPNVVEETKDPITALEPSPPADLDLECADMSDIYDLAATAHAPATTSPSDPAASLPSAATVDDDDDFGTRDDIFANIVAELHVEEAMKITGRKQQEEAERRRSSVAAAPAEVATPAAATATPGVVYPIIDVRRMSEPMLQFQWEPATARGDAAEAVSDASDDPMELGAEAKEQDDHVDGDHPAAADNDHAEPPSSPCADHVSRRSASATAAVASAQAAATAPEAETAPAPATTAAPVAAPQSSALRPTSTTIAVGTQPSRKRARNDTDEPSAAQPPAAKRARTGPAATLLPSSRAPAIAAAAARTTPNVRPATTTTVGGSGMRGPTPASSAVTGAAGAAAKKPPRPVFDLKASLSQDVSWKMKKGPIKPVDMTAASTSSVMNKSAAVAKPTAATASSSTTTSKGTAAAKPTFRR
ncbi:hypothetical protein BC828DRAFT_377913 [Blastocladiella britannica]|nr:hypothetical protein BC828DRAFT_377913 [Blastocladiella britannica]